MNDTVITRSKNHLAYPLVSSSDNGTYHYPGDDLSMETGDVFNIEVLVAEKVATGETVYESHSYVGLTFETITLPEIKVDTVTGQTDKEKFHQSY